MGASAAELLCPNFMVIKSGPLLSNPGKLDLIKDDTEQEFWCSLKSMSIDLSPRLDGFSMEFFNGQWNTIKDGVLKVVREFFN